MSHLTTEQILGIAPNPGIIRCGIINAHQVPWLWEHMDDSRTEKKRNDEMRQRIRECIEEKGSFPEIVKDYLEQEEDILELTGMYDDMIQGEYTLEPEEVPAYMELAAFGTEHMVRSQKTDIIGTLVDRINDFSKEFEQESFQLITEEYEYVLEYIEGTPFVWVLKSPYLTKGNMSATVIDAVDLNSPTPDGYECYAASPDFFDEGKCPYGVYEA